MRQDDPCGLCGRTLRAGDSFHEVIVSPNDPSGNAPGRYNDVCGECAGFEYSPPVPVFDSNGRPKSRGNICSICDRLIRSRLAERLRFMESDGMSFEYGLHAICHDCFEKYKRVVQERVRKPFGKWQAWAWEGAMKRVEVGGEMPTLEQFDLEGYERYTDGITGQSLI